MAHAWLLSCGFVLCLLALGLAQPLQELDGRIVGGHRVDISSCPYQISLRRKAITTPGNAFTHTCGGSIVAPNLAVTAAHCVIGNVASQYKVVAGSNIRNGTDGAITSVSQIIMHEKYFLDAPYDYDIALLVLDPPLPLNNFTIKAIELASESPVDGTRVKISGWGTTSSGGLASRDLLAAYVNVVDNAVCHENYKSFGNGQYSITDSMLCAGLPGVGGVDACQGDSGGPLVIGNQLHGVVSWGNQCALADYPGVYANVGYLRDWLDSKIEKFL